MVTPEGFMRIRWNLEALNLKIIQVSSVMGSWGNNALFAIPLLDIRPELRGQGVR